MVKRSFMWMIIKFRHIIGVVIIEKTFSCPEISWTSASQACYIPVELHKNCYQAYVIMSFN